MKKRLREVSCYLEIGGLKYTGRYRLGGFIVIHVLQIFILEEFSDGWSAKRFFRLGDLVFLFENTSWCFCVVCFIFCIFILLFTCFRLFLMLLAI